MIKVAFVAQNRPSFAQYDTEEDAPHVSDIGFNLATTKYPTMILDKCATKIWHHPNYAIQYKGHHRDSPQRRW
jgi:hypothetical protein